MDNDRVKHSISVARRMVEIGKSYNLSNEELEELFVLGLNHDIGYEFCDGRDHNVVGGNILKEVILNTGEKYIIMVLFKRSIVLYI